MNNSLFMCLMLLVALFGNAEALFKKKKGKVVEYRYDDTRLDGDYNCSVRDEPLGLGEASMTRFPARAAAGGHLRGYLNAFDAGGGGRGSFPPTKGLHRISGFISACSQLWHLPH